MAEARAFSARAHGAGLPVARVLAAVMLFVLALALRAKTVEDSRGIQQAVLLLQESRSRTDVLRAMDTLGEAAGNYGGREAIARFRHGEALLAVVSAMTDFSGQPEIIASACSFISSMSMGKKPRAALAQASAVELIVSALNIHSEHPGVLEQCCGRWIIPFSRTAAPHACRRLADAPACARPHTRTYARTHIHTGAFINLSIDSAISSRIAAAGGVRAVMQTMAFATVGGREQVTNLKSTLDRVLI